MTTVYIASPYTHGDVEMNVIRHMNAADRVMDMGFCAIAPLLSYFQEKQHPRSWEEWMKQSVEKLRRSDILLRLSGYSRGADLEEEIAAKLKIPRVYNYDDLIDYELITQLTLLEPEARWEVSYRMGTDDIGVLHCGVPVSFPKPTMWIYRADVHLDHVDRIKERAEEIHKSFLADGVKVRV